MVASSSSVDQTQAHVVDSSPAGCGSSRMREGDLTAASAAFCTLVPEKRKQKYLLRGKSTVKRINKARLSSQESLLSV